MKWMWISGHQKFSVISITGILMVVYWYVSIVIALQVFVWSVVLWISDTLYTSKFFFLVFGWHIYLTLGSLCFSLYIGTTHYSILQFLVFIYLSSTCLHVLLALCAPGCDTISFRWTQPCWALHLRLIWQFGHVISILSLPFSAASSFLCELYFAMTELYLFLVGLGICAAWASSCVWIALCY